MAALCANTAAMMGTRGIVLDRLGSARRRIDIISSFQANDTSSSRRKPMTFLSNRRMAFVSVSQPERTSILFRDQAFHWSQRQIHRSSTTRMNDADTGEFYANPESFPDFPSLGITSPALLRRVTSPPLSLKRPSAVQAAVFEPISRGNSDIIVGAETGKTL